MSHPLGQHGQPNAHTEWRGIHIQRCIKDEYGVVIENQDGRQIAGHLHQRHAFESNIQRQAILVAVNGDTQSGYIETRSLRVRVDQWMDLHPIVRVSFAHIRCTTPARAILFDEPSPFRTACVDNSGSQNTDIALHRVYAQAYLNQQNIQRAMCCTDSPDGLACASLGLDGLLGHHGPLGAVLHARRHFKLEQSASTPIQFACSSLWIQVNICQ